MMARLTFDIDSDIFEALKQERISFYEEEFVASIVAHKVKCPALKSQIPF